MFAAIKRAGLSLDEFALIISVSRVAVFNWRAGRTKPHPQLKNKLTTATSFLVRLIELKKLPLPEGLGKEERKAKIVKLKDAFEKLS